MGPKARNALRTIQRCVADDRYIVLPHFIRRMDQRGLFWADMAAAIDDPDDLRADGHDDQGRDRWIIDGNTTDGLAIEIVVVIGRDADGRLVVFITIYWRE